MTEEPMTDAPGADPAPAPAPSPAAEQPSVPEPVAAVGEPAAPPRPRKSSLAVTRLIQAVWLGSGVFLMLSAAAAFNAASNTTDAANVVGAILTRWHYIALFAPLSLMFLEWRRSRPVMLVLLFIAVLLASAQGLADTRIRIIRADSLVPISSLPHDDPVRRRFGLLHGASTLFLIGQVLAAAAAVATRE